MDNLKPLHFFSSVYFWCIEYCRRKARSTPTKPFRRAFFSLLSDYIWYAFPSILNLQEQFTTLSNFNTLRYSPVNQFLSLSENFKTKVTKFPVWLTLQTMRRTKFLSILGKALNYQNCIKHIAEMFFITQIMNCNSENSSKNVSLSKFPVYFILHFITICCKHF